MHHPENEAPLQALRRAALRRAARWYLHVQGIWEASREAFLRELDPDMEEARILEERERRERSEDD